MPIRETSSVEGAQAQETFAVFDSWPTKLRLALPGHAVGGTKTVTCAVWLPESVPLAGEKVAPVLLEANQLSSEESCVPRASVSVHAQPLLYVQLVFALKPDSAT